MATWSYRKRITIAPGVRLNISKKGISSTFGMRGASINVGEKGVFLNTGIPGTGIYRRQKIGNWDSQTSTQVQNSENNYIVPDEVKAEYNGCLNAIAIILLVGAVIGGYTLMKQDIFIEKGYLKEKDQTLYFMGLAFVIFFSTGIISLTVSSISKLIYNSSSARAKRAEAAFQAIADEINNVIDNSDCPSKKAILERYLDCLYMNREYDGINEIIEALKEKSAKKHSPKLTQQQEKYEIELSEVEAEFNHIQINADVFSSEDKKDEYRALCEKFGEVANSEKTWIITHSEHNAELKSSASISIDRNEISFDAGMFNFIKTEFNTPILKGNDGAMHYVYPKFIVKAYSHSNFEVFPIENVEMDYRISRYLEKDTVPSDSAILDYKYQYVNKNGSPDKRYANNLHLPVVAYGEVRVSPFNLTYQISSLEAAESFVFAFNVYKSKNL